MAYIFVLDKRHQESGESTYEAATTWEEALKIAVKFWTSYGGSYDPKAKHPFGPGKGYEDRPEVVMRRGSFLSLRDANGGGPCVFLRRVKLTEAEPPPSLEYDGLFTWANEKTARKLVRVLTTSLCHHNTPSLRLKETFAFRKLGYEEQLRLARNFFDRKRAGA